MISTTSLYSIRLFYAAYFASMGLLLPYFPVYLADLGFNELWVGIFIGVLAATKVFSPPLAGLLLEKYRINTRFFLCTTAGLALIAATALVMDLNIYGMLITIFVFGFFWAAILPLTDGVSLIVAEVSIINYGRLRVWGSVGFVLASFIGGLYMVGEHIHFFPWLLCALLCITTFAALGFPDINRLTQHHQQPTAHAQQSSNQQALRWLLFTGFCMQASHGAYYGFFSLYMLDAGYSGGEVGFFWMLGVLAEIILMWWWSKPIQQTSPVLLLSICLILAAIRWIGLAFFTSLPAVLLLQLLHAASFAAFHLSAVAWVRRFAKPCQQASAQGWYSSLGFGLGSTFGILLCGYIAKEHGYTQAFAACAFLSLFGLLAVRQLAKHTTKHTDNPIHGARE